MFGSYNIPFKIEEEDILISVKRDGRELFYKRECLDEKVEKVLLISSGKFHVLPVEPLNKPKEITPYLLIELERPVVVEPKTKKRIYLKFPVEVGVFIQNAKEYRVIDILTLARQKYALYGDPNSGVICRHHRSEAHHFPPELNHLHEGVLELRVSNDTSKWAELTKVVFNGYGMKIYYGGQMVSLKAKMRIDSGDTAETDFEDSPVESGMKKSLELYTLKMLSVATRSFVMEKGI